MADLSVVAGEKSNYLDYLHVKAKLTKDGTKFSERKDGIKNEILIISSFLGVKYQEIVSK